MIGGYKFMNKTKNKKRIFLVAICIVLISALIAIVHIKTTTINEDVYNIVGNGVEFKGDYNSKYFVKLDGEDLNVYCSAYEYLYLTNPKMFSSGEETNQEYLYLIKYKKSVFPFQSAKIMLIKDRIER